MAVGYGELPVRRKAGLQFWVSMLVEPLKNDVTFCHVDQRSSAPGKNIVTNKLAGSRNAIQLIRFILLSTR